MKNRKTNIEELNYRFIKELLNDRICKTFYENRHHHFSKEEFNYDAWCKGLFREDLGDDKYYLANQLADLTEYIFSTDGKNNLDIDYDFWNEPYERNSDLGIDIINMQVFKDAVVSQWMFMDLQDGKL